MRTRCLIAALKCPDEFWKALWRDFRIRVHAVDVVHMEADKDHMCTAYLDQSLSGQVCTLLLCLTVTLELSFDSSLFLHKPPREDIHKSVPHGNAPLQSLGAEVILNAFHDLPPMVPR